MIFISNHNSCKISKDIYQLLMETFNCKKCGLTIAATCSKCDRVIDVKISGDGCLVKENKCFDCTSVPIIKDVCLEQKTD